MVSKVVGHFTLSPEVYESFSFFTSSPKLGLVNLFHSIHSVRYVVVSNCGFNWHSPHGKGCWTCFRAFISIHSIFSDKPSVQIFFPFFIQLFDFLVIFGSSLPILDTKLLLDMCFATIFSKSVGGSFYSFNKVFWRIGLFNLGNV